MVKTAEMPTSSIGRKCRRVLHVKSARSALAVFTACWLKCEAFNLEAVIPNPESLRSRDYSRFALGTKIVPRGFNNSNDHGYSRFGIAVKKHQREARVHKVEVREIEPADYPKVQFCLTTIYRRKVFKNELFCDVLSNLN